MGTDLQQALEQLYYLKRDRKGTYERPHKPAMLLAVIDLIDSGEITANRIGFSDGLRDRFKQIFAVVKQHNDKPTVENPFFHLSSEDFWMTYHNDGQPLYIPGRAGRTPTIGVLKETYAQLTPEMYALLMNPVTRAAIREALVSRYFPNARDQLIPPVDYSEQPTPEQAVAEDDSDYTPRSSAFAKTVKEIYDYRCAACGLRLMLNRIHFVDAAHLVPFAETHNDHPSNGMALCKNHHWALDEHLIAPDPDLIWRISPCLDDRNRDHQDLTVIAGAKVIGPQDKRFIPNPESLEYRITRLLA